MGPRLVSRGYAYVLRRDVPDLAASMGPRLVSRGYTGRRGRVDGFRQRFNGAAACQPRIRSGPGPSSKCAERFNGAAACQPRIRLLGRCWVGEDRASMGPRLVSRGYGTFRLAVVRTSIASMGPRLVSRGYGQCREHKSCRFPASMGPRLVSRGYMAGMKAVRDEAALQWGRGL